MSVDGSMFARDGGNGGRVEERRHQAAACAPHPGPRPSPPSSGPNNPAGTNGGPREPGHVPQVAAQHRGHDRAEIAIATSPPTAIDSEARSLFAGTGNNYTAPPEVEACHDANPWQSAPHPTTSRYRCARLKTGKIKWARDCRVWNVFNIACLLPTGPKANCPLPEQPGLRSLEGQDRI